MDIIRLTEGCQATLLCAVCMCGVAVVAVEKKVKSYGNDSKNHEGFGYEASVAQFTSIMVPN